MDRLSFLADEHVDRTYVNALRAGGFAVGTTGEDYRNGVADEAVLEIGRESRLVLPG